MKNQKQTFEFIKGKIDKACKREFCSDGSSHCISFKENNDCEIGKECMNAVICDVWKYINDNCITE